MAGDAPLGIKIRTRGEKYYTTKSKKGKPGAASLVAWNPVVVKQAWATLPFCNGVNGPTNVNCRLPKCDGTNGLLDGGRSSGCIRDEPKSIPHYNRDPKAGRPYETTGDLTRNSLTQTNQKKLEQAMLQLEDVEAEKVSVL